MHKPVKGLADQLSGGSVGLTVVTEGDYEGWLAKQPDSMKKRIAAAPGFKGRAGQVQPIYVSDMLASYVVVTAEGASPREFENIPDRLPAGKYTLLHASKSVDVTQFTLGWALGNYRFDRYKSGAPERVLKMPAEADAAAVRRAAQAIYNTRELINTPANDLGPQKLTDYAVKLAQKFNASASVTLVNNDNQFPLLWAVGKAAMEMPRMVDITWSGPDGTYDASLPTITLIGKGVIYDTGGLALKTREGMLGMKKDMGGAAHALGLAQMIMDEELPVNLRVLLPIVENSINEKAFRNGDIIESRSGLTIEVVNTDAEGRLILADALTLSGEGAKPDLIVDFATLTAAARTVGEPGVSVVICNDKSVARKIEDIGEEIDDRLQSVTLDPRNAGKIGAQQANLANSGAAMPSHIFAAHFLNAFSPAGVTRIHIDHGAWNAKGAEDQGLRTAYEYIKRTYTKPAP